MSPVTGTNQALGGTSGIAVNSGGTLNQTTSDQVNNSATMTLSGGTYRLNTGVSEGTTTTVGLGALTLTSNSVIDLAGTTNVLHFANSSTQTWTGGTTLSIYNYSGVAYTGNGSEQLLFGTDTTGLTATQLSQISFYSGGAGSTFLGTGGWALDGDGEVVPVPEPSTWAAGLLTVLTIGYTQRRRIAKLLPAPTA